MQNCRNLIVITNDRDEEKVEKGVKIEFISLEKWLLGLLPFLFLPVLRFSFFFRFGLHEREKNYIAD
jgi:hypothetical protein